jgi:hypothetical protein
MTREEAMEQARNLDLKPGETIYCLLRHVASTGMSRRISFLVIRDNEPRQIDHIMVGLGIGRWARKNGMIQEGVQIGGAGMDMGFACVYELGRELWPNGFKLPKGRMGRNGDRSDTDRDGGYALQHRWL